MTTTWETDDRAPIPETRPIGSETFARLDCANPVAGYYRLYLGYFGPLRFTKCRRNSVTELRKQIATQKNILQTFKSLRPHLNITRPPITKYLLRF